MLQYLLTCVPGMEHILADEIYEKLSWKVQCTLRGMLIAQGTSLNWQQLGCADNVYHFVGESHIGTHKPDLPALGIWAAELMKSQYTALPAQRLRVTASRRGKHSYSRFDAAGVVEQAVSAALGWQIGDEQQHDIALRLDIDNDNALLSHKLSDASFRFRGQRDFVSAALRPTVAHGLVRLSQPNEHQIFWDPFCGSGTIPLERATYLAEGVFASDIDAQRLEAAHKNDAAGKVRWQVANALSLPCEPATIDMIVTNPPWGVQVDVPNAPQLCDAFLRAVRTLMKPDGAVYLLQPFAPHDDGWHTTDMLTLSLHGMITHVFRCKAK